MNDLGGNLHGDVGKGIEVRDLAKACTSEVVLEVIPNGLRICEVFKISLL